MEVILLQDIEKLGGAGQIAKVADGYGRNFLLPKKMAVPATPGNLKMWGQRRAKLLSQDTKNQAVAEKIAATLQELTAVITRKAGEKDTLFGSVTTLDIAEWLHSQGHDAIDRRKIVLPEPIKVLGEYNVSVKLHRNVTATLKVRVEPEADPSHSP